jgi:glycosyltransferase involved in cell wall biosynthesis
MKISVVVPAYNEESYIRNCLKSLMAQEVKPDEILVINNNSTDKTAAIAKEFPVRIITEKQQGITHARNRGFNEAQYEIIARTDADTIVPSDWVKRIKKEFQNKSLVALSGPAHFYDLPDVVQTSKFTTEASFSYIRLFKQLMRHDCLYGPNMALRKSAWQEIKKEVCLDDREVHEDIDLAIHLARVGEIKFDYSFVVESSFRRWKKIDPYFEYMNRLVKSIRKHKTPVHRRGSELVKRIVARAFPPEK